uniref:Cytochrome c oxidase subunit 2 n=1 Tax=Dollfustrema vaneyi TaxID=438518 RepID=A0AAU7N3N6_9TREM
MVGPSYYHLVWYVLCLSVFIIVLVVVMLFFQVLSHRGVSPVEGDSKFVEFLWTFIPSLFVGVLCYMNIRHLDRVVVSEFYKGVKVVGRQWYWSYASVDTGGVLYDSVITDFVDGVDKPLRMEYGKNHTLYITSADVIHSFSIPFLGIKGDAVPGRVNQIFFNPDVMGSHVGYCSELCGVGHAYMPIVLEVIDHGV